MAKDFVLHRVQGIADHNLPAEMLREIGRLMVRWAQFEYSVQQTVWETLGVTPAQGRIAIREPRVPDRLEMINDILSLRNATWDGSLYTSIIAKSRRVNAFRDLMAHGIWGQHDGAWHCQLSRGS